jgi:hypothetical protein
VEIAAREVEPLSEAFWAKHESGSHPALSFFSPPPTSMRPIFTQGQFARPQLLFLSLTFLAGFVSAEDSAKADSLSWEQLSADAELYLDWSRDPLAEVDLAPEPSPFLIHSGSLRAGFGHSDNYLKRATPTHQDFHVVEGDFFLNALLPRSSLTVLMFGEWTQYAAEDAADAESLAFGLLEWSLPASWGTYGLRGSFFYGDQIYDASLSIQAPPAGASFRQFRPELAAFLKREVSSTDTVEATFSLRDAGFDDPQNDYWRGEVSIEWTHKWSAFFAITTDVSAYGEEHRIATSRGANGIQLNPRKPLYINGAEWIFALDGELWEKTLGWSIETGANLEVDRYGDYEDLYRSWAGIHLDGSWKFMRLEANVRVQETRYDKRQIAYLDTTPVLQQFRNADLKVSVDLPKGLFLEAQFEWLEATSRIRSDSYSEQRAQVTMGWSY